jgi:hypothetical protein
MWHGRAPTVVLSVFVSVRLKSPAIAENLVVTWEILVRHAGKGKHFVEYIYKKGNNYVQV